jgi:hypothetical protein
MNFEPGIVKTVNLDNEQLLMIESRRGDFVCVVHRGVCLIGCSPAQGHDRSGGAVLWPLRAWIRSRFTWHRSPAETTLWKGLRPAQWA